MSMFILCKDAYCWTDMGIAGRDGGQRLLVNSKSGETPPAPSFLAVRKGKDEALTQCDGVGHSGSLYTIWEDMRGYLQSRCTQRRHDSSLWGQD